MQKVYYNKKTNHTVIDVSGAKPLELIEAEFGKGFDQMVEIDENLNGINFDVDKKLIKTKLPKIEKQ